MGTTFGVVTARKNGLREGVGNVVDVVLTRHGDVDLAEIRIAEQQTREPVTGVRCRIRRVRPLGEIFGEPETSGRESRDVDIDPDTSIIASDLDRVRPDELRPRRVDRMRVITRLLRCEASTGIVVPDVDAGENVVRGLAQEIVGKAQ